MIELVKELSGLFGPSGREEEVRQAILDKVRDYADELIIDNNENVLVFKKGKVKSRKVILLAAHMDEVGVIVKGITDEGYLKFSFVGGVDSRVAVGKQVVVGEDRVRGVIGIKAIHLAGKEETAKAVKADKLTIDIGALSRQEAEKRVCLGDYGCFCSEAYEFGNGMLKAKALDDRVGCAVLIDLIQKELPVDTWFAFTVQEEIGTRGAFGAAFKLRPDIAMIVEGTTAADLPSMPEAKRVCAPGKGIVIPFMDGGAIYDRSLFELLRQTAEENKIPWQTKQYISGGTDASAIQRTAAGTRVCGIAAPLRYIHSPSCVGAVADIEAMPRLAVKFLEKLAEGRDEL